MRATSFWSHRRLWRGRLLPCRVDWLAHEELWIGARARVEFLHAAAGNFGDIEIAFLVHACAVHVEKTSGPIAESAPRIQKVPVGVVLPYFGGRVLKGPHFPAGADVEAVHR